MGKHTSYIVKKIKEDDIQLFEAIYKENYHGLIAYAQRFVFSKEDARGIIQDVFVKMWEIRASLPEDLHIRNYLFTSVRNRCLDFLKHQKQVNRFVKEKLDETEGYGAEKTKDQISPLDALITKELQNKIIDTIDTLPPRCREVFILSRFEGLSYREISEELNLSVKTIETHISRALHTLRKVFGEMYFRDEEKNEK